MLETLFAFLFKYRPAVFERGDFVFASPKSSLVLAPLAILALFALWTYARRRGDVALRDRLVLGGLRLTALGVLLFCLLGPVLRLSTAVPQQNFVAVLIDDSRSMRIPDMGGESRSAFVDRAFGSPDATLLAALEERFQVRFFRFSSDLDRVGDISAIGYGGDRTDMGRALDRARQELAGLPVSGLVVVSDGADNAQGTLAAPLLALKAAGVPVFTVGLGRERLERDIQISRVEAPRSVAIGTSLVVDVVLTQTNFRRGTVPLQVEDGGRIVAIQEVDLPGDGEPAVVQVRFEATEPGPRRFRFRVPAQQGETVTENNVRDALIVVEDRTRKVLYFEGEPRFEVKFIRRAVADDSTLQVVLLQRTAENKFLRLDVDSGEELEGGFPTTREELFSYRGLILGSVEASFFSLEQLQMIADFVEKRGGGLMMLGGRRAFAEGGWAGTPVADALPVVLEPGGAGGFFTELSVRPSRLGLQNAALQLGATEQETADRWGKLPALTTVNRVRQAKPGATVLLTGTSRDVRGDHVVLAHQRYGRGMTLAFAVQDSWQWQMHADIPVEDMTHETLWRQLIRWLVADVAGPVVAAPRRESLSPGERAMLLAGVSDSAFSEVNNGQVVARVSGPEGEWLELPMEWTAERDGEYRAAFTPETEGIYEVRIDARRGDLSLGLDVAYLDVAQAMDEYFDAGLRAPLLRRVADDTGGRYYTPETVGNLPEDLRISGGGTTVLEIKDLWDMPGLFLLLLLLVAAEWSWRRARGLA